ncbi:replicative DNA helicase [Desulforamulus aquiferis]|uniref:Replicative DNA helicase n=1 Tax=Desulforamulus aquiferis TaxID=1397668 RepID=A0AAW7ZA01_9FIRM|nr:replicative DNA helicase [Desulforamulus aquiferis]MDO7786103.1 replicative DNA helicase [Desulforamulus aquiferis]
MDFTQTKTPPSNIEAEQSVLGAILLDNSSLLDIAGILRPDHFYREQHRIIYQAAIDLHNNGQPVDLVTLTDKLQADGNIEKAGGFTGVATLANLVPTSANAVSYARIVRDKAITRAIIKKAAQIMQKGYSEDFDSIEDFITEAQTGICDIESKASGKLIPVKDLVIDRVAVIEKRTNKKGITGIPTGHTRLDAYTAGWQPGDLIILAARPSMGKTTYAMQLSAEAAIKHGKKVANFSIEMTKESLLEKWFCNIGMIDTQNMRIGKLTDEEWKNLHQASTKIYNSGLYIDDDPEITVMDIKNRSRRMKQQTGLDLIVVDYLQLIKPHKKTNNRNEEIGQISWGLKSIAKELQVPVIVLSQLSRDVEKRSDKTPMLSDLRDSGSIEQDADIVCFMYRDDYYTKEKSNKKGITDLIIAKQRLGPTGKVELYFQKQWARFAESIKEGEF